jgi:DNA ligase-1
MQTRIGRKNISKKQLQEAPISFFVYDILEYNGIDIRNEPLHERRNKLEQVIQSAFAAADDPSQVPLQISTVIPFTSWDTLTEIRTIQETTARKD